MAPLIRRIHFYEIDDQTWFHPWLRGRVQAGLTVMWNVAFLPFQKHSAAQAVAGIIEANLAGQISSSSPAKGGSALSQESQLSEYVFIDFCAGGGGPTPSIERAINAGCSPTSLSSPEKTPAKIKAKEINGHTSDSDTTTTTTLTTPRQPAQFVLTDLYPHVQDWKAAAALSPNLTYEPSPVDASAVPAELLVRYQHPLMPGTTPMTPTTNTTTTIASPSDGPKKIFRLFNLAFHHFPDPLAKRILHNTLTTSSAFGIFELQDRSFLSFLSVTLLGLGSLLTAPYWAWVWGSPLALLFSWVVPVIPFVLWFDGLISSLRTRTPAEVEALMRTCGLSEEEVGRWEVRSGEEVVAWPFMRVGWVVALKKED